MWSYRARKKYDEWSEDFGDEEDPGAVSGVIVGEMWSMASPRSHTALAIAVASQKFPRSPDAENSEDADGQIGHADFVFVRACRPAYRG